MDKTIRRKLISDNLYLCQLDVFKNLTIDKPIRIKHFESSLPPPPHNFAEVYINNIHSLLLAETFVKKGLAPILVTTINRDFDCTNLEKNDCIYDDILNTKTNYIIGLSKIRHDFPLKDGDIVYSKTVHIIRDTSYNPDYKNVFAISVITVAPRIAKLVDDKLILDEYLELKLSLDTAFQTAIRGRHNCIILDDMASVYNKLPVNQLIDLYNIMVLTYGAYFKFIVVAIPVKTNDDMIKYKLFDTDMIKPQALLIKDTDIVVPQDDSIKK